MDKELRAESYPQCNLFSISIISPKRNPSENNSYVKFFGENKLHYEERESRKSL